MIRCIAVQLGYNVEVEFGMIGNVTRHRMCLTSTAICTYIYINIINLLSSANESQLQQLLESPIIKPKDNSNLCHSAEHELKVSKDI